MNSPQLAKMFTAILVDECLHPETLITMHDNSQKPIKDIVVGDKVKTLNETTGCIEDKPVVKLHNNLSRGDQMFCITLENGKTLKITGNHKVKLKTGNWKKVEDLCIDDDIIEI
jgi:intein/homing endonuclease